MTDWRGSAELAPVRIIGHPSANTEVRKVGDLKRYVDEQGRMRSLTAKDAERIGGFTLADQQDPRDAPAEQAAPDEAKPDAPVDDVGASVVVERSTAPAKTVVVGKGAK